MEEFRRDIEERSFPVVIGFDLDGIYGIGEHKPIEEVLEKDSEESSDCWNASLRLPLPVSLAPRHRGDMCPAKWWMAYRKLQLISFKRSTLKIECFNLLTQHYAKDQLQYTIRIRISMKVCEFSKPLNY